MPAIPAAIAIGSSIASAYASKKIAGKGQQPAAAAPASSTGTGTGGGFWSTYGPMLQNVGQTVAGAAQGAAQGRMQEGMLTQGVNELDLARWIAANNARQQQAEFNLKAPTAYARQGFLGNLLSNDRSNGLSPIANPRATPMSFGGMNPADFSPALRSQGDAMQRNALINQLAPPGAPSPMAPQIQMPQAGFWDKLGGAAGTGLSILGSAMPQPQTPPVVPPGAPPATPDVGGAVPPSDPYNLMPPNSPFFRQPRRY